MNNNESLPPLVGKAEAAIKRYNMLADRSAVLVGVSGGADSMALLHYLCSIREKTGIKVYAAHVNHGIRGEEAKRDENYVKDWCAEHDVPVFLLHADVIGRAKNEGETVEEAGRKVRYSFFEQKASEIGAVIATAHTLSDSIETFLINFARGTGLRGLCGIPPVRGNIIRPLIRCTRHDTEEYCQYFGIKYLDDSTNFTRDYTRNRIRLDVIPELYRINPSFDKAAARLFDSLEEDRDYLESEAEKKLASAKIKEGEYLVDKLLNDCNSAVLNRCVSLAASAFSGKSQEALHIAKIIELMKKGKGKTEIRGGCFANVANGRLIFTNNNIKDTPGADFCFPFKVGIYENPKFKLVISPISRTLLKNFKNINKRYFKNAVDCDKIRGNALVHGKSKGDKIKPAGRNVTKTLKKLFNENKVPVELRPYIPVAYDDEGVIWAGGIGVDERCKVTEDTENAFLLEIKHLEV